jgi:hypothetical protein
VVKRRREAVEVEHIGGEQLGDARRPLAVEARLRGWIPTTVRAAQQ